MSGRHQRSLKRININLSGRTDRNQVVVKGAFKLVNERGIPFDVLLEELRARGMVLDWEDFMRDAINTGWTLSSFCQRAEQAVIDVYPRQVADEIMLRIKLLTVRLLSPSPVVQ